jgi:hypothetical protein
MGGKTELAIELAMERLQGLYAGKCELNHD